jgi:DNA-binding beta-propeller fold protein YncE
MKSSDFLFALLWATFLAVGSRVQADAPPAFLYQFGVTPQDPGQFFDPYGVATDVASNVYVADTSNHRLQKFDANGNFLLTWGSRGTNTGQFQYPYGVAVDPHTNVFVLDNNNSRTPTSPQPIGPIPP